MSLRIRRGTDLERSTQLFDQGEIVYTTDTQRLYIGDGSTLGGISVTGYTTAEAQDAAATIFTDGSHTGISFDYDDITKTMNATVTGGTGGGVTYGISSETTTGGVNLRLSGSDASVDNVKFAEGSNITLTRTDASTITIASTASGSALTVKDEGTNLTTNATSINFTGAGVTASHIGDDVTVTISGAGGGGATTLDDLTDVDVMGAVTGNILKLNGSGVWVDDTLDLADLADVSTSLPTAGQSLIWTGSNWTNGSQPVSVDTAPTLGGDLDLDGYLINGFGSIDLTTETLAASTISIKTANNTNTSSIILLSRANGTIATPTTVNDTDGLGAVNFSGYDGTTYYLSSSITASAQGSISTGIVPSRLLFSTTDATGTLATRVTVDNTGALNALYGINLVSTSNTALGSSLFQSRRSRGTSSARTAVQNGDSLLQMQSFGFDGTNYTVSGVISSTVSGTVSTGIIPSSLTFSTTDTSGNLNDAVVIGPDGHLRAFNTVELLNINDTQGGPNSLNFQRARGTLASPTTVINGDALFELTARAYEGTSYVASSAIRFQHQLDSTISTGIVPGRITFVTADATGVLQKAVYIDHTQRLYTLNGLSVITDDATKTNSNIVELRNYHASGTDTNNIAFIRYRGTITVPAAVQAGDYIYDQNYMGYDGTNITSAATIRARVPVGSTVSAGIVPGSLSFGTRNQAGTFAPRLTIDSTAATFAVVPTLPTFASETAANTAVGTAVNGMMYYDSGAGKIKGYQGGAWVILQP